MKKKYGYIYLTYNKINGKIYIGQHKGETHDETYFGSGKLITRAINKYGIENFENHIIEWCYSKEELNAKEIYWIAKYNCNAKNGYGYNIGKGGEGNLMEFATEEAKKERAKKISEAHQGKTRSEEHRRKISETMKGKTLSEEHKIKISENNGARRPEVRKKLVKIMVLEDQK